MDYTLLRLFDRQPIDRARVPLDVHVLARAYAAAWRSMHRRDPVGQHVIENLGLAIDFGALSQLGGDARPMESQIRLTHVEKQMAQRVGR